MASITTINLRILNAINLKNQENLYFAIGRTTAWDDEENPDTPSTDTKEIDELIYIKKISIKQLVKLDDPYDVYTVSVTVDNVDYNYVAEANAYTEEAHRVYLSSTISYDSIAPTDTSFRQIGILLDPLDSNGDNLTGVEYLAASVANQGQLLYYMNRTLITRDPAEQDKIEIIINC